MAKIIHDGKYRVATDDYLRVIVKDKKNGVVVSQSVEALLLLELVSVLKDIKFGIEDISTRL